MGLELSGMRLPPQDVPPLSHQGIVYRAPHHGAVESGDFLARSEIEALLQEAARGGQTWPDERLLSDPDWVRGVLQTNHYPVRDIERTLDNILVNTVWLEAIRDHLGEVISQDPDLSQTGPEWALSKARADGRIAPRHEALMASMWEACKTQLQGMMGKSSPRHGGWVVAYDEASGDKIWQIRVYQTEYDRNLETDVQDVYIRSLSIQDGYLLVRDEDRRIHRVDLSTRKLVVAVPTAGD